MTRTILLLLFSTIAILFQSCYNDSEENIYGTSSVTACDSLAVNYSNQMKPIFDNNCNSCHTTQFPNLNTYANVFSYVKDPIKAENMYFVVAVNSHQGVNLTVCDKAKLKKWLSNPAP